MLRWALGFLVVAVIAAIFGFTEIAEGAAWIARFLCFLFVAAFVFFWVLGVRRRRVLVLRVREARRVPGR